MVSPDAFRVSRSVSSSSAGAMPASRETAEWGESVASGAAIASTARERRTGSAAQVLFHRSDASPDSAALGFCAPGSAATGRTTPGSRLADADPAARRNGVTGATWSDPSAPAPWDSEGNLTTTTVPSSFFFH